MKNLLLSILVACATFLYFYLIGAFYSISFNLNAWPESCRSLIAMIGGIFSAAAGAGFFASRQTDQESTGI